jgi:hypothetical protein
MVSMLYYAKLCKCDDIQAFARNYTPSSCYPPVDHAPIDAEILFHHKYNAINPKPYDITKVMLVDQPNSATP